MKACSSCGRKLPEGEFWRNRSQRDGLDNLCKASRRPYTAASAAKRRARR